MNISKFLFVSLMVGTSVLACSLPSMAMEREELPATIFEGSQSKILILEEGKLSRPTLTLVNQYFADGNIASSAVDIKTDLTISKKFLQLNVKEEVKEDIASVLKIRNTTDSAVNIKVVLRVSHGSTIEETQNTFGKNNNSILASYPSFDIIVMKNIQAGEDSDISKKVIHDCNFAIIEKVEKEKRKYKFKKQLFDSEKIRESKPRAQSPSLPHPSAFIAKICAIEVKNPYSEESVGYTIARNNQNPIEVTDKEVNKCQVLKIINKNSLDNFFELELED